MCGNFAMTGMEKTTMPLVRIITQWGLLRGLIVFYAEVVGFRHPRLAGCLNGVLAHLLPSLSPLVFVLLFPNSIFIFNLNSVLPCISCQAEQIICTSFVQNDWNEVNHKSNSRIHKKVSINVSF